MNFAPFQDCVEFSRSMEAFNATFNRFNVSFRQTGFQTAAAAARPSFVLHKLPVNTAYYAKEGLSPHLWHDLFI
jgi:hypothetical protein